VNPLGERVRDSVLRRHPEWAAYVESTPDGDLQLAVPAPRGSRAKHLLIFTDQGKDIWLRFAPPRMCYAVETDREMHVVIEALLADNAFLSVVTNGDEWIETTVLRPGEEPVLAEGQVANIVSWSGHHDRIMTVMGASPARSDEGA
jgi:hypothetical protein